MPATVVITHELAMASGALLFCGGGQCQGNEL